MKNMIVTMKMIQKAESTSDPIVKALVPQQAIVISKRYGFVDDLWGDLSTLAFDVDFQLNNPTYPKNSHQQRTPQVRGYS
ncbi:MAG: hypothetical protein ACJASN_002364 [Cyclobacteriaceae bacterium]|jgi:hypothetical protein